MQTLIILKAVADWKKRILIPPLFILLPTGCFNNENNLFPDQKDMLKIQYKNPQGLMAYYIVDGIL